MRSKLYQAIRRALPNQIRFAHVISLGVLFISSSAIGATISGGSEYSLFLRNDGTVWACGYGKYGALGNGTTYTKIPLQVMSGVQSVAAGEEHSLFLKTDGSVWATGRNYSGELGDGTNTDRATPVNVMNGVKAIAAGGDESLFLKTDGSAWTTTSSGTPVQILTGVKAIAEGISHSLFLKTDGTVWARGGNYKGQLGDGTQQSRTDPIQVMSGVKAIAAGWQHSLFLKLDGSVWACGIPYADPGADGLRGAVLIPWQVTTGAVAIADGYYHSLIIKADGTAWTVGYNGQSQLGDGTRTTSATPVQVLTGVAEVAGGWQHSLFLKSDGTIWASGYNFGSQLGDGTSIRRATPVQVFNAGISSGGTAAANIIQQPTSQIVSIGQTANFSVSASSAAPLAYQWRKNGNAIAGATNSTYSIANVASGDAADYSVLASNSAGFATSNAAILTIVGSPSDLLVITTLAGLPQGSADGTGTTARFSRPTGVVVDAANNIYLTDTNNTIRKITSAGVVTTLAGNAGSYGSNDGVGNTARFDFPEGVTVDSSGNVYVADFNNSAIRKITPGGMVSTIVDRTKLEYPMGIAIDGAGNLYAAGNYTVRKITSAGVVTTLAGSAGSPGSNDGVGSSARFVSPNGVAVDSAGNVYVADSGNQTIRKIAPAGAGTTTLAGSAGSYGSNDGTGSAARFNNPSGVAVDGAGNVYVADSGNQTIRKISPAGVVTTLAGSAGSYGSNDGTGSAARFFSPSGVAVDSAGNVLVTDQQNSIIRKITPSGVVSTIAGIASPGTADGTGSAARFNEPKAVAVGATGNVYAADYLNNTIRKITPAGVVSTLAGTAGVFGSVDGTGSAAQFIFPAGVAVDAAENVYVGDSGNNTIRKITPAGVVTTLAGSAGNYGSNDGTGSTARFSSPSGMAVDGAGNLYVADSGNHTIRKITPAGVVTTLAGRSGQSGSSNGTGTVATFNGPHGLTVDNAGNVYVADRWNSLIRKITSAGVVTTLAGRSGQFGSSDSTGSGATFSGPSGVAVDNAGNVYVADSWNSSIRKIAPAGMVTTIAGLLGFPGSADGTGSAAQFNEPSGLALDSTGKIYIADISGNTIRIGSVSNGTPAILAQPSNQAVIPGQGVSFSVTASGIAPLTYQWRKNSAPIAGATQATYTIVSPVSGDAGNYSVVVNNGVGSAIYSDVATLTINAANAAIQFTTQPQSSNTFVGTAFVFSSWAKNYGLPTGAPLPTYQWQKNGINIPGATNDTFGFNYVQLTDAGSYAVIATSGSGSAISNTAQLTVSVLAPSNAKISITVQ